MTQRLAYASIPGLRDEALWPTITHVLRHLQAHPLEPRALRDWFKAQELWHKDDTPTWLGLLDVRTDPHVTLGPWAIAVLEAQDNSAARTLLWRRLCDENLLLCKYVLQALDTETGGRLHSTSELHRMLTSYVYPGQHVGRVAFEAWMTWAVASGRIKLVGIRWGLTDLGKQALPELRRVDADEFLDDEQAASPPQTPPPPAPVVLPPPTDPAPLTVAAPPTVTPPARAADQTLTCTRPAPTSDELLQQLQDLAQTHGLRGGPVLEAWGLEARLAHTQPARHLFVAGLLARLTVHADAPELAALLLERAGSWGPVALLLERPDALPELLVRWGLAGADGPSARLRATLLDAVLGGRALQTQLELPVLLATAPTSEALLTTLHQGLLRAAPLPVLFWLVRELVVARVWTGPAADEVAFVPTRAARLLAYRLRLVPSHFAPDLAAHIAVARRLRPLLVPGSPAAAAWEVATTVDHLRWDCTRVLACLQPCGH